jgi:hypothetical protein
VLHCWRWAQRTQLKEFRFVRWCLCLSLTSSSASVVNNRFPYRHSGCSFVCIGKVSDLHSFRNSSVVSLQR